VLSISKTTFVTFRAERERATPTSGVSVEVGGGEGMLSGADVHRVVGVLPVNESALF